VADSKQFGSPKILQFGDKTAGNQSGDGGHCAQCQAMLTDAIDGTLSAADQELFDRHMAECGPCAQLLADAHRGAAWLEILRDPAPQPSMALLERILAQTSGAQALAGRIGPVAVPAGISGEIGLSGLAALTPAAGAAAAYGRVIPFRSRVAAALHRSPIGQIMLQPRLAMTAAMAFLSIALTMDLTGIHPFSLRASDLKPSSLRRDFYSANARVVQYYEGLRVVYELESRVHDLQSASDNDAPQSAQPSSASPTPAAQPDQTGPAKQGPAAQPNQKQGPGSGPHSGPASSRPTPNSSTSRREGIRHDLQTAAAENYDSFIAGVNRESSEGGLA